MFNPTENFEVSKRLALNSNPGNITPGATLSCFSKILEKTFWISIVKDAVISVEPRKVVKPLE
jgi:hypothetical protein